MHVRSHRRDVLADSIGIGLASTTASAWATVIPFHTSMNRFQEQGADWTAVQEAPGTSGEMREGDVFRASMPRTDLEVTVQGVPIMPGFALGSYAAFEQAGPTADDTMVMGDLVLLNEELNGVMSGLFEAGLEITGVPNHLNEGATLTMYMHYMGMGKAVALADGIRQALSASGTPPGATAASSSSTPKADAPPMTNLHTQHLEETWGYSAKVANGGVVGFSMPRAETIMEGDVELVPSLGGATVLNIQPIEGGQAAITGDFLLLGEEVNPVAHTLRENHIEVHALHSHHLAEKPRCFCMHFFATGDPAQLTQGFRAALDQTNSAKSSADWSWPALSKSEETNE